MTDEQTIEVYNASVDHYLKVIENEPADQPLNEFISLFTTGDHVLDFGCGPGRDAAAMKKAGLVVTATDASAEMVEMARTKFGLNAFVSTFDQLSDQGRYDGIWANFSLLHAPMADFPKHLSAIHAALKSSGLFHIGMKLGKGEIRDKLGRQYAYYSEDELLTHLRDSGFSVESITRGEGVGLAGDVSPWLVVISKKTD